MIDTMQQLPAAGLLELAPSEFLADVLCGLRAPQKELPCKYFYDATGSELFEQITVLPEYYPTRTELGILRDRGSEISALIPKGAALVEFGAGATTKVRRLLNECAFGAYVPVDISGDFLKAQADVLRQDFPDLAVYPVAADFTATFALPEAVRAMPKVGFFPDARDSGVLLNCESTPWKLLCEARREPRPIPLPYCSNAD